MEELEDRSLLTVYSPAQVLQAYGFDQITFGSIQGDGTGQTIAIVDAYDAPKLAGPNGDLHTFDVRYGISDGDGSGNASALSVVYTAGNKQTTSKPAYNSGWSQEITLDVQWAHAIAPGAHILLVEAASNSFANLFGAVDFARNYPGVSVVSMSWGANEFSSEASYDSYMTTPANHNGVSFIASSGDSGGVISYPAVSPNVLGVGGTSLFLTASNDYSSETGWSSSGGGISAYESKPTYQSSVTQSTTRRTTPDVGYDADPNTGVSVYWTSGTSTTGNWYSFGGTSAGAPQWAALVAIADQGRSIDPDGTGPLLPQGTLDGRTQLLPAVYNLPASDFNDITSGRSGRGKAGFPATAGYDLVTGRGSPIAYLVVQDLLTADAQGTITPSGSSAVGGGSGGSHSLDNNDAPGLSKSPFHPQTSQILTIESAGVTSAMPITVISVTARLAEPPVQAVTAPGPDALGWLRPDSGVSSPLHQVISFGASNEELGGDELMPTASPSEATEVQGVPVAPTGAEASRGYIDATANDSAVPLPTSIPAAPEPTQETGGVVAYAVKKAAWIVGAVAFFTQGAFLARTRPEPALRRKEQKRTG